MKRVSIILFLLILASITLYAKILKENIGITFGNVWVGARYNINSKVMGELRKGLESDINIDIIRGYYNVYNGKKIYLNTGLDFSTITFNLEGISGNGTSFMPYINCEIGVFNKILLSADFGYSIISLGSQGVSISGGEIIFDISIVFFPWKK